MDFPNKLMKRVLFLLFVNISKISKDFFLVQRDPPHSAKVKLSDFVLVGFT